jgi:hypothetical protein
MGLAIDQESGLAVGSCGKIVAESGRLVGLESRWWPYWGNRLQVVWDSHFRPLPADRCELYYHMPLGSPDFLTLSYIRSSKTAGYPTVFVAMLALDEVARILGAKAAVCHVTNGRISDRTMQRFGWSRHCHHWAGRHFIKRFYGHYPSISPYWRDRLCIENMPVGVVQQ